LASSPRPPAEISIIAGDKDDPVDESSVLRHVELRDETDRSRGELFSILKTENGCAHGPLQVRHTKESAYPVAHQSSLILDESNRVMRSECTPSMRHARAKAHGDGFVFEICSDEKRFRGACCLAASEPMNGPRVKIRVPRQSKSSNR